MQGEQLADFQDIETVAKRRSRPKGVVFVFDALAKLSSQARFLKKTKKNKCFPTDYIKSYPNSTHHDKKRNLSVFKRPAKK